MKPIPTPASAPTLSEHERGELLFAFHLSVNYMRRLLAGIPAADARTIGAFVIDAAQHADDPETAACAVRQIEHVLKRKRARSAVALRLVTNREGGAA